MSITEVQRIPGQFQLPENWPKLEFPDIESGLLFDWVADDLTVGTNVTNWLDRVSGAPLIAASSAAADGWKPVQVVREDAGNNAVVLAGVQRLGIAYDMPQEITVNIIHRTDADSSNTGRLLSGGPGYRMIQPGSTQMAVVMHAGSSTPPLAQVNLGGTQREKWQSVTAAYVSGRGAESRITAQLLGGPLSTVAAIDAPVPQTTTYFGYNPTSPPNTLSAGYKGRVHRITIWARGLSELDVRAVNRRRQLEYPALLA